MSLSYQDLLDMPQKRFQVTFECCGNSPVPDYWGKVTRTSSIMEQIKGHGIMGNAEWAGVSLADVLQRAGVKDSAVEVTFEGADHGPDETVGDPPEVTYERSLPIAKATHPDTLLAYQMNGEPLPAIHGFPLRLLVSGWYGMNSVKWLVGIHVLDHVFDGFYQTERYMTMNQPGSADPFTYYTKLKVKSIITNPAPGEVVPLGGYRLTGVAWSGEDQISLVEISDDGGQTWFPVDRLHPPVRVFLEPLGALLARPCRRAVCSDVPGHQRQGRDPTPGVPQQVGRPRLRQQHGIPPRGGSPLTCCHNFHYQRRAPTPLPLRLTGVKSIWLPVNPNGRIMDVRVQSLVHL